MGGGAFDDVWTAIIRKLSETEPEKILHLRNGRRHLSLPLYLENPHYYYERDKKNPTILDGENDEDLLIHWTFYHTLQAPYNLSKDMDNEERIPLHLP